MFRLWIGPGADGATRITLAEDGQPVEDERFVVDGIEALDVFGQVFRDPTARAAAFQAARDGLAQRIGDRILQHLAQDRARLWIAIAPSMQYLERLPWELVASGPVILSKKHEMAFELPIAGSRDAVPVTWPLRVCVWVGSAPGSRTVEAEAELRRLEIHLDHGHRPTPSDGWVRADVQQLHLANLSEQKFKDAILGSTREPGFLPHVLHFVGHGEGGAEPALIVELSPDGRGARDSWTAAKLGGLFSEYRRATDVPRLVVLNACDTARTLGSAALTSAFASWGVSAVVAMVAPIGGAAAGDFSDRLYARLQDGDDVPEAVRAARCTLGDDPAAFAVPRLYLRASHTPDVPVLSPIPREATDARQELVCPLLASSAWYCDRHDVRWKVWRHIVDGTGPTALVGGKQLGKSTAARVITERALVYGFLARYIDVTGWGARTWLGMLQAIRDVHRVAPAGRIDSAWPKDSFGAFNALLHHLEPTRFTGFVPTDVVPEPARRNTVFDVLAPGVAEKNGDARLIEVLRGALAQQARPERPVLLVLDNLPVDVQVDWALNLLTRPPIPDVRVLLIGAPTQFAQIAGRNEVNMPRLVGSRLAELLAYRVRQHVPTRADRADRCAKRAEDEEDDEDYALALASCMRGLP